MWTILIADKYELEDTKHEIITRTANCKIFTYYLDLGCFSSVRTFANSIKKEHKKIDVLINNAGIFKALEETTVDNLNPIWQINHLGPFLLTVLLADLLKRAAPSRVIFMASSGAFFHTLDRNTIPDLRSRDASNILEPARTYYNSKLYNMIVCKELSQKMGKHNVTSNCLHPGMTNSGLLLNGFNLQCFRPIAHKLVSLFTQDTEKSAQMVSFLATSQVVAQITGQYFVNYQASPYPKILEDEQFCKRVWKQAEELVNLTTEENLWEDC
uniref:Uncharacterized protein n=2 Tax=Dendroctonus ponderosae TaxID=77166 RepID=A0AAR5PXM5_DENPD